jgi:hypothetical protein
VLQEGWVKNDGVLDLPPVEGDVKPGGCGGGGGGGVAKCCRRAG